METLKTEKQSLQRKLSDAQNYADGGKINIEAVLQSIEQIEKNASFGQFNNDVLRIDPKVFKNYISRIKSELNVCKSS